MIEKIGKVGGVYKGHQNDISQIRRFPPYWLNNKSKSKGGIFGPLYHMQYLSRMPRPLFIETMQNNN